MTLPITGAQYALRAGGYRAGVVGLGGALRTLEHDGVALIDGFAAEELPDAGRGQILAPWPNRLKDGAWWWRGRALRLPVDEPDRGNSASHGLVRWREWTLLERHEDSVRLGLRLDAQPGYPFRLGFELEYRLHASRGLTARLTTTNAGTEEAPVALGAHPYLVAGASADDCRLRVPAARRLLRDAHGVPHGEQALDGLPEDLREGAALSGMLLNDCYTDLRRDADGRVRSRLVGPERGVELWAGVECGWIQVYTGDGLAEGRSRRGVAVEPMTAPPQALASGEGLRVLEPGSSLTLDWGLQVLR